MRADVVHQFGPAAGLAVVDVCGKGRKQRDSRERGDASSVQAPGSYSHSREFRREHDWRSPMCKLCKRRTLLVLGALAVLPHPLPAVCRLLLGNREQYGREEFEELFEEAAEERPRLSEGGEGSGAA